LQILGTNLINNMAEETTSLVDAATESAATETQETQDTTEKAFDVKAFLGEDVVDEMKSNYDESKAEELDTKESSEEATSEDDGDGFSWGEIETPQAEEAPAEEPEEDWDDMFDQPQAETQDESNEEAGTNVEGVDWKAVAKELGLEAASKEDFQKLFEQPFVPQAPETEAVVAVKEFLNLSDRQLVVEEMKTDGMSEDDIMDIIDKMEDTGTLKREAFRIRKQLNQFLEQQQAKAIADAANEDKTRKERVESNKKELQSHLKQMKTFMGGKVNKKDLQEVYKYIVSGNLAEDIWKSHGNAAEVAMFLLYKDKFAKILRTQGREEGKAGILDSITSPEIRTGSKSNYKPKGKGFDVSAFMRE
jgi:arsenate reductase-like glutaredoxin family protein